MEEVMQEQRLVYAEPYTEYTVQDSTTGGIQLTIFDNGCDIVLLFIPDSPDVDIPPDFLENRIRQHWKIIGSRVVDFCFYIFDPRIYLDFQTHPGLGDVKGDGRPIYLQFCESFRRMSLLIPRESPELPPGLTVTAAAEAREMGCVEGDGFEMLNALDEETRDIWKKRLKRQVLEYPGMKMRAIFQEVGKDPLAFLPYIVSPSGKTVKIKQLCLEQSPRKIARADWQHIRRVLFRSIHERSAGKEVWVDCPDHDDDLLSFLENWGYDAGGRSYLEGGFW